MEHIGGTLKKLIKKEGLEKEINQQKAIDLWEEVVGQKIKNKNKEKSQTIITTTNIVNIKENGFFMEFDNIKKHHLVKNGTT